LRPERTASQLESRLSIPPINHGNQWYQVYQQSEAIKDELRQKLFDVGLVLDKSKER
jgi:hypothetical protein